METEIEYGERVGVEKRFSPINSKNKLSLIKIMCKQQFKKVYLQPPSPTLFILRSTAAENGPPIRCVAAQRVGAGRSPTSGDLEGCY